MVYVDIPGLPKDLNVDYRPPRVSLFPPSYRERAILRSLKRQYLHQNRDKDGAKTEDKGEETPEDETAPPAKETKLVQTIESHCYHECAFHPREKDKKDNKKDSKQKQVKAERRSEEEEDSDVDDESGQSKKWKDKSGSASGSKNESDKTKKGGKKDDSKLKVPDALLSFLPYPFNSANAEAFWGSSNYQKVFPEKPFVNKDDPSGWNLDYKLEAARRADERYMWTYLSQQEGQQQRDAFRWLAERDAQRQAKLTHATAGLAGLSFDDAVRRTPPGLMSGMPGVYSLNNPCGTGALQACYDQQGNLRLPDGRLIFVSGRCPPQPQEPYDTSGHYPDDQHPQCDSFDPFKNDQQHHGRGIHQYGPDSQQNMQQGQGYQTGEHGQWQNQALPRNRPQTTWRYNTNTRHNGAANQGFGGGVRSPRKNQDDQGGWNGQDNNQNFNGQNNFSRNNDWNSGGGPTIGGWNENKNSLGSPFANQGGFQKPSTTAPKPDSVGWGGQSNKAWNENDDNQPAWGVGNDENSKPDNFFEPQSNKNDHHVSFDNDNNDNHDDAPDVGNRMASFFNKGSTAENQAAVPTMSGAKKGPSKRWNKSVEDW